VKQTVVLTIFFDVQEILEKEELFQNFSHHCFCNVQNSCLKADTSMLMQLISACKVLLGYALKLLSGIPINGKRENAQKIVVCSQIQLSLFYELHLPSDKYLILLFRYFSRFSNRRLYGAFDNFWGLGEGLLFF